MMYTPHKITKIGIMPLEDFKKRTLAIAKGIYRSEDNEPKIWFTSIKALSAVVSEDNQKFLQLIIKNKIHRCSP